MAGILARSLGLLGIAPAMPAIPVSYVDPRNHGYSDEFDERSLENPAVPLSNISSWDSFFGGPATNALSGVSVGPESALRSSAVYACINVIAKNVAMLPRGVYKDTPGGRILDRTDPLQQLFFYGPNEFMNWYDFLFVLVATTLANGNGYARVIRDPYMKPIGLRFLKQGQCSPVYVDAGPVHYLYYNVFGEMVEKRDIIHIRCLGSDGVIGKSPIELFAEGIGLSLAAEQFGARFYGQGGNHSGVLEHPGTFKDQGAIDRLRKQYAERQSGLGNAHKPLILEGGMKFTSVTIPQNHAQFIETRSFQVEDIARMYGVPQHKIGKLDRSTNNNIEHQAKEFVTDTILPWTERIRQEFERKLIAESDKETKEIVFDFDFLLRGDSAARAAYYQARFATGSITGNEIRRKENENPLPIPGMDDTFIQQGFAKVRAIPDTLESPAPAPVKVKKTPTTTKKTPQSA